MTPVIHLGFARGKGRTRGLVVGTVLQTQRSEHLFTESIEVAEVVRDDFVDTTIVNAPVQVDKEVTEARHPL